MTLKKIFTFFILITFLWGCGKVGPLNLPEDKLDKSVITYPCDEECKKIFPEIERIIIIFYLISHHQFQKLDQTQ